MPENSWVISHGLLQALYAEGLAVVKVKGQDVEPDIAQVSKPSLVSFELGRLTIYPTDFVDAGQIWIVYGQTGL